jgi:hypothetical protein
MISLCAGDFIMNVIETIVDKGCNHIIYDNGIHEFAFTAPTREAVDSWISMATKLYAEADTSRKLPILHNTTQAGVLPFSYIIKRMPALTSTHASELITRTALLAPRSPINDFARVIANNVLRTAQFRDEVKFFMPTERDDAIIWLLWK